MKNNMVNSYRNGWDLFDDVMTGFFKPVVSGGAVGYMRTDVVEGDNEYTLEIELPGFDKNELSLNLKDGYLEVSAVKEENKEEGKKYASRERYTKVTRSYYVGEKVTEEDIKAKYENGVLKISFPKNKEKVVETKKIAIE